MKVKKYMFETKHLRIRKFENKDAQCLYENHLDEEVKNGFQMKAMLILRKTRCY